MPCTYYSDRDYLDQAYAKVKVLRDELDGATALLCDIAKAMLPSERARFPALSQWYEKHRQKDQARLRAEIQAALDKVRELERELEK